MRIPFAIRLASRELRSSWRRIGVYMAAISMGVAALVAINSFRANVVTSIRADARTLLGGDIRIESSAQFTGRIQAALDSVAREGVPVSYVTSTASMVYVPRTGRSRLFQLRAIEGTFPHYSEPETEPAGLWPTLGDRPIALADPALLVQLDARIGDTIQIGAFEFELVGTVSGLPSEVGIQTAIGPRVFIGREYLARTDLIRFGSLVEYQAFLRMPEVEARAFEERYDGTAREDRARIRTADDQARSLIRAYGSLADFLGLVGLTALLLGGVGVASAVHVFVKEKLTTVAMLRCLGATQRSVFVAYLLQAGLLGFAGATAGVVAGVGLQAVLPALLAQHLPVPVEFHLEPWPVITGLGIGVWVAALFSVLPLLSVRNVAPLQALRRDVESAARQLDPARWLAGAALVASVVALSVWQAPNTPVGLWYATGLIATTTALWGTAALLIRATRRFFPARAPYVVRQGIANLFRPRNQTVVVTLSIGFGVFLLGTLYLVQHNLLAYLDFGDEAARPSILLFDVQPDQRAGIDALVRARGLPPLDVTPLVPARIAAVNGRSVEELIRLDDGARWALRREYRNTYRDTLGAAESLVAGEWWDVDAGADAGSDPVYRISVEDELARSLGVGIGDRITWDVQGVQVESRISSLRSVDWTALSPNFFVIFEPGSLDRAPQTLVALGRVEDPTVRAELQRDIVIEYPNVSVLDLAVVQETVDAIAARVALGIRALALFTLAGGVLVLAGAIATSRYQRRRESALLRALGASRGQIARVLLTEYTALGSLAALTGLLLACVAAWLLTERLFNLEFTVPPIAIVAIWSAVVALTLIIGAVNSRDVLRRPPIEVLQEAAD